MNLHSRLNKLESHAATLPPNGLALIRQGKRLPEGERAQWLDQRTDEELESIRIADGGDPVNWDLLTIAELEQIASGEQSPLRRVQR